MRKLVTALALTTFAGAVFAQQALKPEEMIKYRKAGYSFMSWNMGKIKANIEGTYNKEQVVGAANLIAATANSGMGALYGPGTDKEAGGQKTRVKPEFFKEQDKVRELAMTFIKEANELQKVAATGDAAAVKAQFGKTGESCKACHDKYRND
ncbi:MAG TPA: cytochrome c [Accumulibacter sp.]|uniref:c-type cytochrome n=1 Tax=Accumulibacter sp. TaxID=2053492 RepID=UPI00262635C0|nr:cytochrome c [Accumulibacter sp.]MDS4053484.1 cytochrome c [Accumulibacter sp.]HMV04441.1 cytochrome c [Accumulibacter sp.]HMW62720.1 cytochrome c [Accumulibacter sp.]HMW79070.1 cytochrome c [Accumulibacter sp.]HMX68556.1 cytochrome c [Accumulibacter sp.]